MAHFDEINFLSEKARALCAGLSLRLDEFVNEFPAGSPNDLIRIIKSFLTSIDSALSNPSTTTILYNYFRLIETLSEALDWLDNAHTAQTPKSLVQSLEEVADSLYSNAKLLVSPSSEYNYSIVDLVPFYRHLAHNCFAASSAAQIVQSLPTAFYLVRFPRIEREDCLNHAIFGHEFGHPIADEFLNAHEHLTVYATRLGAATHKIQSDPILAAALSSKTDQLERSRLLSKLVESVVTMHRRALEELVSDAVGAYLFGPSALFASMAIFGQGPLDAVAEHPSYYPPSRRRIRLVRAILEQSNHLSALSNANYPPRLTDVRDSITSVLSYLESVAASNSDVVETAKQPLARIAYEWLDETLPDALDHAKKRTDAISYRSSAVSAEIPALLERLSVHVPPNEIGTWPNVTTADWRSGLLASWLMALAQQADTTISPKERRDRIRTTQKVASKGLEYALLQRHHAEFLKQKQSPS